MIFKILTIILPVLKLLKKHLISSYQVTRITCVLRLNRFDQSRNSTIRMHEIKLFRFNCTKMNETEFFITIKHIHDTFIYVRLFYST